MILGDEILAVNGLALQGMSHSEAISVFKNIRVGKVVLHLARRDAATRREFDIFDLVLLYFENSIRSKPILNHFNIFLIFRRYKTTSCDDLDALEE